MITIFLKHRVLVALTTASIATALLLSAAFLTSQQSSIVNAFQPTCRRLQYFSILSPTSSTQLGRIRRWNDDFQNMADSDNIMTLYSSVGGGGDDNDDKGGKGDLGDFLDPMRKQESENLKRAREFMSERSLPLSFDTDEEDYDNLDGEEEEAVTPTIDTTSAEASSLTSSTSKFNNSASSSALFGTEGSNSSDLLAKNPYMQVVSRISPSEVIAKFTATADPRVQEAVRTTILGLIGSLPKLAFDTTCITTGQRLASLMFQLQMTGYMFKNAEYRMSMSQSLGMYREMTSTLLLTGAPHEDEHNDDDDGKEDPLLSGKIKGKLRIRYGKKKAWTPRNDGESVDEGREIEVDAAAYMSELRSEVTKLRDELLSTKEAKEEALRKDLLLYIRTLPAQELKSLTNTMSQDVLVCMKGLVQAVLAGIGDGQIGPDTVTEQSGEAMAQLCMWQLAVGYNLRELEVREEMKKNLQIILGESNPTSIHDISEPGAFE